MRCVKCGTDNREGRKFCAQCGQALKLTCPSCSAPNEPGEKFCGDCGGALVAQPAAAQSPTAPSNASDIRVAAEQGDASLDGERKTVTALLADIKGSTELERDLDPEEARPIVDPALRLMIEAVRHYDGYVVQSTGDGIFALFGAPLAHEDHPQRALYAALRMQEELRRYSTKLVANGGNPVEARVGVHTGEVVVRSIATGKDHTEYTPIGHTTNLASRMQAVAPTGSIAATHATRKLCEGYFNFRSLGPTVVKGVSEPVEVYEVAGLGPLRTRLERSASRGYTKFVGRRREMDALKHAAELAKAGHGQMVAAVAEPGVGKSRLFYEFKAVSRSEWMVLEGFSVSHGKATAYLPVIELLHDYFRIVEDDDARTRREKVGGKALMLDRTLEDTLPYLLALLGLSEGDDPLTGMDAQMRRRRTHEVIKRILLRESLSQPLIVIFEDLHWIDGETQALLNMLVDSIGTARILLLVSYRPEYQHQWGSRTYYTQLRLDPLGRESADEMLRSLLGEEPELAGLKRLVIERTEGNPFFIEEAIQALFDEGVLLRNGAAKLIKPLSDIEIPPTVQAILAERIDRLPSTEKELLQTLAVIGDDLALEVVKVVTRKSKAQLEPMLADLQLAEFIYERPAVGDIEYTFKHALTQEVAYGSLLLERRRATHDRVAIAIEALYKGRLEEHLAELARHYRHASKIEKAIHYLRLAAEQSADRSALSEAETQLRDAIALLITQPASSQRDLAELRLQTTLGSLLSGRSWGAPERETVLRRAYELSERIADPREVLPALFQLGQLYIEHMRLAEARELSERAVILAGGARDLILELGAWSNLAESCFWSGDLKLARAHSQRSLALSENLQREALIRSFGYDIWLDTSMIMALTDLLVGLPDQATRWQKRVAERAMSKAHPFSQAFGKVVSLWIAQLEDDPTTPFELMVSAFQVCGEYGFHEVTGWVKQVDGWMKFRRGERASGIAQMREAIEELRPLGSFVMSTWRLVLLADMQLGTGDIHSAEATAAEAVENLERTREGWCEPEVYRVGAGVLLRKAEPDPGAAEMRLRRAIGIAQGQGTKWWELRATMSLARLLAKQGRRDEARAMLAEIYGWFTEGFDTADLKEDAKALLDQLSA